MTLEGIIIYKSPFKERDLIIKLLKRDGTVSTVMFYGGQGGGKNKKPSLLDLGAMIEVTIKEQSKHIQSDILIAKEWST